MRWTGAGMFARASPLRAPFVLSSMGVLLGGLWAWYVTSFDYLSPVPFTGPPTVLVGLKLLETGVVLAISASLVYAGYWFSRGEFTAEQEWWGALWTFIGGLGIVGVVLVINAHQTVEGSAVPPGLMAEELILGGAGGSLAGLLIGIGTAQSMQQADRLARQRDAFEFLNKLLRHNILNGIAVIQGKASLLEEGVPATDRSHLDAITARSESIAELTQNVREIAGVISGEAELESVNLPEVLASEVETARRSFDGAEFEMDVPGDVTVSANRALRRVFENLLDNAVRHNDAETPRVDVSVEVGAGTVRVNVADNGPGIPDGEKAGLFEPSDQGDHGMGLYLVDTIVRHYGGRVRVEDNEPSGTVFTVSLREAGDGSAG